MLDELKQYQQRYKIYEDDPNYYSMYVHGYFIPWLERQRAAGKLKHGKLTTPLMITFFR